MHITLFVKYATFSILHSGMAVVERWKMASNCGYIINCRVSYIRDINVALLCVQENAADRPNMSDVVAMLSSKSMTLPEPKHPAYFYIRVTEDETSIVTDLPSRVNDITTTLYMADSFLIFFVKVSVFAVYADEFFYLLKSKIVSY